MYYINKYMKRYAELYCNDIEVKIKNLTITKTEIQLYKMFT